MELAVMTALPSTAVAAHAEKTRTAPAALFLAAAGFAVEGVITLVHHTGDQHWDALSQVLNAAYALAALALIVALPTLGRWLQVDRLGRGAVVVTQIGCAAMVVESVVSGLHDGNILGGLFFVGLLLSLVGLLILAITAMISGHRRREALLPFFGMLVGIAAGEHGGSLVTAAIWIVLGVALLRNQS